MKSYIRNLPLLFLILSSLTIVASWTPLKAQLDGEDEEVSEETTRGVSRGECDQPGTYDTPLTLIAGASDDALITSHATPRLYVYVPFTLRADDPGRFILQDSNGIIVDRQPFTNVSSSGILEISINHQLQVGEAYKWFFETFCNDPTMSNSTENSFLEGSSIRREAPSSTSNNLYNQLQAAADSKRQGNPTDWNNLLSSIGLSDLVDENIISP